MPLSRLLDRSDVLHETILRYLDHSSFYDSSREEASFGMCSVSLEHAQSLRLLFAADLPTSAVGLLRLQFEALTRAIWLLYAAPELAVEKLMPPLSLQSEQGANNLPSLSSMVDEIGRSIAKGTPTQAHRMLVQFKDVTWKSLNSYVHGGIHPLRRHTEGFPIPLAAQIVQSSNGLLTMAGMTLAVLTGEQLVASAIKRIPLDFEDCLPPLIR
ncbi:hypothetical protein [Variovorax sp. 770b2]|jgi:hypothetical protein|uniref:DUF6988 family protein n=1 Tax=Variovorax sp. 770b2 TaxID=1566271 RepID=UPI0008DF9E1F|nr:hypothetical protein [Variovorax sp. 770b2]SFQ24323.1 hypothetical protein SAMN03159339_6224 [Variovorax sp. 770b2]